MAGGLSPESILRSLENRDLAPFYLFYGPNEFRLERVLEKIRKEFVTGPARDFNVEICYGGETESSDIITRAQTIPFMSDKRLIVVRRTEEYSADQLNRFLPYLQKPSLSTCLIFLGWGTLCFQSKQIQPVCFTALEIIPLTDIAFYVRIQKLNAQS